MKSIDPRKLGSILVDMGATTTLLGIWPRYIEPKLIFTSRFDIYLPAPREIDGLKIVQFSDLHFHKKVSNRFLKRVGDRILREEPDLIFFTGDFICYSTLEDADRLHRFLSGLKCKMGAFAVFGNHDYSAYVSRNRVGDYDVLEPVNVLSSIKLSLHILFKEMPNLKGTVSQRAASTPLHAELVSLISNTPFTLLDNKTVTLPIGLNIVGLGDYALGRFLPDLAFKDYNPSHPGIILSHNPDTFPHLAKYPGELVLSGHTHGEQIHLPFLPKVSKKLARLENNAYTRGRAQLGDKTLYINRGLGSHKPFRFFAPPEITVIHLRSHENKN